MTTEHRILSLVEWANSNGYPIRRYDWPQLSGRSYNSSFGTSLSDYASNMDSFHTNEGATIVEGKDVKLLQIVWPSGGRRYEILGRDGSILCDPFSKVWYRNLQNLGVYGRLTVDDRIDIDVGHFKHHYRLADKTTYLIGDTNHGHWLFDHFTKAFYATQLGLPPLLIRELDHFKLDTLRYINARASVIPDSYGAHTIFHVDSMFFLSNPPPSLIPATIRTVFQHNTSKPEKVVFFNKRRGNLRLANREPLSALFESLGVSVIDPSMLSLAATLETISSARLLIAPMGAELTNVLFTTNPMIGLFPKTCMNPDNPVLNLLMTSVAVSRVIPIECLPVPGYENASPDSTKFFCPELSTSKVLDLISYYSR